MRLLVFFGMQWIVKEINRNTVNRIFGFYYLQYLNKFILQWNSVWTICSCRQNMITIHRMLSSLFTMSNVLALFFIRLWSECRGSSDNRKKNICSMNFQWFVWRLQRQQLTYVMRKFIEQICACLKDLFRS